MHGGTSAANDAAAQAWRAGRAAWPAIAADEPGFRAYLAERTTAGELAWADLYLAYGCARGAPAAPAAYDELVAPILARLAQRWCHARIDPADLAQALRVRLFVGGGDGPPRIAQYRGEGSLAHWLRIAAAR